MAYPRQQGLAGRKTPGDVLLVVHDFDARSTDELTLRKGDRIELVELDEGFGDGWFLGRHLGRGGTGLFPGVYTTKVPSIFPNFHPAAHIRQTSLPNQSPQSPQSPGSTPFALQSIQDNQYRATIQPSSSYQNYNTANGSEKQVAQPSPFTTSHPELDSQRSSTMGSLQPSYSANVQRSIGQTLNDPRAGQDSPVMNETLSVIDEHMQDMSTPRHSLITQEQKPADDSESEYSSHQDRRESYVAGPETDEEEGGKLTESEVKAWDHKQTANHLRGLGVDSRHCDIFEEQEITGDVLLEMDQAFVYMKEYDFGVMGRRLKTWHKIRDFQDEVRGSKISRQTTSTGMSRGDSADDLLHAPGRIGSSATTMLPRIPNLTERPGLSYRSQQQQSSSYNSENPNMPQPLQTPNSSVNRSSVQPSASSPPWRASTVPDSPSRPSAALVREISHSRRHSSIDVGGQPASDAIPGAMGPPATHHKKQDSFDRGWSMTSATFLSASTTAPSLRLNTMKQQGYESSVDTSLHTDPSSVDLLDRGYFSGNELDSRKTRNVLRKRDSLGSPVHSRQSSMLDDPRKNGAAVKRHSRLSSVDSVRELGPRITSSAAKAYHSKAFKGRMRSASERTSSPLPYAGGVSPTVTNLEVGKSPDLPLRSEKKPGDLPLSSVPSNMTIPNKARRMMGLRATSEVVTGNEKSFVATPGYAAGPIAQSPIDSPTGSNTPSATSRSFEIENADMSSKGTDAASSTLASTTSNRTRPKTKKETSAYTRGLLKTSPGEARKNCDHSGWMKKKSSSLLTTWKPRLFILRGRRLSYYYAESDTEERGIIDISGHKVLVANSDPVMNLHATLTGASSTPTPASAATSGESSPVANRFPDTAGGPFYFKLVPPKVGLSRAVQFTKPTIHYFQVDSLAEGRKWMGEMMKATIEHDLVGFETTNKQKTISLAKARARRERPPALKETAERVEEVDQDERQIDEVGLKIQGLNFEKDQENAGLSSLLEEKANGEGGETTGTTGVTDTGQEPDA